VHALCAAAATLAARGDAQAIVAVTRGGSTARQLSILRPRAPILAVTRQVDTARRLALYWGVVPVFLDLEDQGPGSASIGQQLVAHGLVASGAAIVLINIDPDLGRADANYLRIQRV